MIPNPPVLRENLLSNSHNDQLKRYKSKNHKYNKCTQVRLHHDPCLKIERRKREFILTSVIETGGAKRVLKQNPNENV